VTLFNLFSEISPQQELLETHPESPPSHGKNVPISLTALPKKLGRLREKVLTKINIYAIT
jgi:hypothetical protein